MLPLKSKILINFKFIDAMRVRLEQLDQETLCAVSESPISARGRADSVEVCITLTPSKTSGTEL